MWQRIRSFTQPPAFTNDEQKSRQARLLNDVLLINLLSIIAAFFVSLLYTSAPKSIQIIILLVIPVILLLIGLMKAGYVNFASVATVLVFLFGVTGIAYFLGPHGTPILAYYLLAIVIAGLLLDSRALAAVTVFSGLAVGGLIFREIRADEVAAPPGTAAVWLTYLVIFANTGLLIRLARRRYLDELNQRKQAEFLALQNEDRYRQLYTTAQRQAQELQLLDRVRLALARELDLSQVIRTVVEATTETFGYALVSLYLLKGNRLILQHQVGYEQVIPEIPLDQGISGRVARSGKPVLVEDVRLDSAFLGAIEGIVSEVCIPLFDQGQVAGTLNVESTQGVKLGEADLQLMTALSEHISIAIARSRLYAETQSSEERYRTLAESAPDSIFIINRSGVLTYANSAAASILTTSSDEAIGAGIQTLLRFQDAHQALEAIQKVFETCMPHQSEYRILSPEKETWYDTKLIPLCENSGAVIDLLGIAWNITERKQAETHLQEYAKELTALNVLGRRVSASLSTDQVIQAALEEIMPCLAPDLALLFLGDNVKLTLRGINSSAARQSASFTTPHQVGNCLCGLAASKNEPVYSYDIYTDERCQMLDCKEAGMRSFAALPLLGKNEVIGVLGLGSTTERNFEASSSFLETIASQLSVGLQNALLHEEVQRHALEMEGRVRLRTAELETKNRELETFSYTVSHDLKAPLRGIDGYSRLLLSDHGESLNSEGQVFLKNIRSGITRMSQLIDDLLAYSRLERHAIVFQEINPRLVIDEILAERLSDPNNRAEFHVNLSPFIMMVDPESLSQALRNLIDNAIKFSSLAATPSIEIGGWQDEQRSVLWVRDNGIGLDMRYADRIFEIFHRLNRDEDFPGTGVGLAIVRKAMEQIGGRAWVESILGKGASFYLELPRQKLAS